jgi:predicted transcriptional regulator
MTVQAVSKHIKVLEGAGLITRGREAQYRPCHLEAAPLQAVEAWLEDYRRFWDRSLDALSDYLKTMPDPPLGKTVSKRKSSKSPARRKSSQ